MCFNIHFNFSLRFWIANSFYNSTPFIYQQQQKTLHILILSYTKEQHKRIHNFRRLQRSILITFLLKLFNYHLQDLVVPSCCLNACFTRLQTYIFQQNFHFAKQQPQTFVCLILRKQQKACYVLCYAKYHYNLYKNHGSRRLSRYNYFNNNDMNNTTLIIFSR